MENGFLNQIDTKYVIKKEFGANTGLLFLFSIYSLYCNLQISLLHVPQTATFYKLLHVVQSTRLQTAAYF